MRKMITILLVKHADIVNLDSCCLYTNREVANSAALSLHSYLLYRVNKTSGIFWLTQAFTKLHALRLQGENLLFEKNVSRVNM